MKKKSKDIALQVWVNLCRLVLGGTFLFSGFVKAVDPLGSYYKMQDYLTAFGLISWVPDALILLMAILLAATEFGVGAFLLIGIRRGISALVALVLMVVMTPLTLYLALANPVSDCGCFGDAWVLSNWQTFGKNVVLLVAAISIFRWRTWQIRFVSHKVEWMMSMYTLLFIIILSGYCLRGLPILDFRPYHVGANIPQGMEMPEGAEPSRFESLYILEKNGERREFTLDNYPDSTWTFVEAKTKLVQKGYEPPIHDFAMTLAETGEEITDRVLADTTYTFLLVAHRTEFANDANIDLINEIYDYSVEHGYGFYALTSSPAEEIEQWRDRSGAEYPFCQMDDITLKTIVRANPGLLLVKEGTIYNKWSHNDLPDEYVLTDRLERIPLGTMQKPDTLRTIGRVMLWYFIPLMLVIALDLFIIKRRDRKLKEND